MYFLPRLPPLFNAAAVSGWFLPQAAAVPKHQSEPGGFPLNNLIQIAIVDDMQSDLEKIRAMLLNYADEHKRCWQIDLFSCGEDLLQAFSQTRYAIVFLDIVMNGMNGIETARRLREQDLDTLIVFITTESGYAVEGYEVEAAGFLIKEEVQQKKRFERLMERVERRLQLDTLLDFTPYNSPLQIPAGAMLYADVLDHNMQVHVRGSVYTLRMTMEELKALLPDDGRFFECHRGIPPTLDAVAAMGPGVFTIKDGHTLPVSRRRRAQLEKAYIARSIAKVRGGI